MHTRWQQVAAGWMEKSRPGQAFLAEALEKSLECHLHPYASIQGCQYNKNRLETRAAMGNEEAVRVILYQDTQCTKAVSTDLGYLQYSRWKTVSAHQFGGFSSSGLTVP